MDSYFNFPRCEQCGGKLHEFGQTLKCGDCGLPAGRINEVEEQFRRREAERLQAENERVQRRSQQLASDMAALGRIEATQAEPVGTADALASRPVVHLPVPDIGPEDMTATEVAQVLKAEPESKPEPAPRKRR